LVDRVIAHTLLALSEGSFLPLAADSALSYAARKACRQLG
jgi:hypothetical protein